MSLVFQNIAGGNSAATKTAVAGNKTSAGTAAGSVTFNQSLDQLMTGEGTPQSAAALIGAGSLLEGLMKLVGMSSATGDETSSEGQDAVKLLDSMLGDAEQLDEAVTADPDLLAALQGWLGQIQNMLNQQASEGEETAPVNGSALTGPLSEHPATIRFVVQDGLAQLVTMLQKSETNESDPLQAIKLLQSFQNILTDAAAVKLKPSSPAQGDSASQYHLNNPMPALAGGEGKRLSSLLEYIQKQSAGEANPSEAAPAVALKNQVVNTSANNIPKTEQASADELTMIPADKETSDDVFTAQNTITAGQLTLRQGIQSPVKALTAAPVPVERFSEEMSGFVVSKMDFIKQQGVSEARITLYPENLGQVDVKLTMQNGHLVAQFTTEHAATKDLLEQQMSQLRSSLQTQGVQVEKLVVSQNQSLQSQMYHDGRQPNSGQQQGNRRSKEKEAPSDDAMKIAEIGEELNEWLAEQEKMQSGNSFTAKA